MLSCHDTSLNGSRVALLSCGQFDPPSYAHLRMFERARDFLVRTMGCMVVELNIFLGSAVPVAYLSYRQHRATPLKGIMSVTKDTCTARTSAKHRLRMVETALRRNCWIW
ncbi:unnamed protein product [Nippostrongylus brasiliensis]|uniref:Nicotinamide mononucleotide adenylyltransferase 2 (inferred by orthology to a human protein) n=1 Tax=Nippostrongylus brasiliensis TaxID=27835 RepID=A0A0N4YU68_NIPBR|nr:unnamed protein product [Nippostrongylus brasiliensis]